MWGEGVGAGKSKKEEEGMGSSSSKEKESRKGSGKAPPAREKATITSSDRVKLQLKMQRDNLVAASRKFERVSEAEHEKAKEFMKVGNKRKALYCLKREKAQQAQLQSVTDMLDNVQKLIDSVEFSQMEEEVVAALKDGKTELERLNKMLSIDDIEKLMDETAESIEEARQIDALLSQPVAGVTDDDELLRELEGQMGQSEKPVKVGDVKVPKHPLPEVTPGTKAEEPEGEEEGNRVLQAA